MLLINILLVVMGWLLLMLLCVHVRFHHGSLHCICLRSIHIIGMLMLIYHIIRLHCLRILPAFSSSHRCVMCHTVVRIVAVRYSYWINSGRTCCLCCCFCWIYNGIITDITTAPIGHSDFRRCGIRFGCILQGIGTFVHCHWFKVVDIGGHKLLRNW